MTKRLIGIWAQAENGVIGKDRVMPWHLPAELKHFKETTVGHAILMGRVTFEGMKRRVLPNRVTIILTHDRSYHIDNPNVLVMNDLDSVLTWFHQQEKKLFIIGGAKVFAEFEPYLEALVMTDIHAHIEGDTYFPENFDFSKFVEVSQKSYPKDAQNAYDFTVRQLERKN